MPSVNELRREIEELDRAIALHESEAAHFSDFVKGQRTRRDLSELHEVYGDNMEEMATIYERSLYAALARIDALKERKAAIERLLERI